MRYFLPPPNEEALAEGFTDENDIFGHKKFSENLTRIVETTEDPLVVALDGPWGSGKSTFARMWAGENEKQNKMAVVYFDAFANDHRQDAFTALAGEIYALDETNKSFLEKATQAGKFLLPKILRTTTAVATAGLSEVAAGPLGEAIEDIIKNTKKEKDAIKELRESLEALAEEKGNGKNLIFIIDELDRCRPTFALDLLEQIKHIFSVKGVVFVLVTNLGQLANTVRMAYGTDEKDCRTYLDKFYHLRVALPETMTAGHTTKNSRRIFAEYAMEKMGIKIEPTAYETVINALAHHERSFRSIERILTYFASYLAGVKQYRKYNWIYYFGLVLSIARTEHHEKYNLLKSKSIDTDIIKEILNGFNKDETDYILNAFRNSEDGLRLRISLIQESSIEEFKNFADELIRTKFDPISIPEDAKPDQ